MTPTELKAIRVKLGHTQAELGALLGYTRMSITYYETGVKVIPVRVANAVTNLAKLAGAA